MKGRGNLDEETPLVSGAGSEAPRSSRTVLVAAAAAVGVVCVVGLSVGLSSSGSGSSASSTAFGGVQGAATMSTCDVYAHGTPKGSTEMLTWGAQDWTRTDAAYDPSATFRFSMFMKQDSEAIFAKLDTVSDPNSATYGQQLTRAQVTELSGAEPHAAATDSWLATQPVISAEWTPGREIVTVTMSVQDAEAAFCTSLVAHTHVERQTTVYRSGAYVMPYALAPHVQHVSSFMRVPTYSNIRPRLWDNPDNGVQETTPDKLHSAYSVSDPTVKNTGEKGASQGVFETSGYSFKQSDIDTFDSIYDVPDQTWASIVGWNNPDWCQYDGRYEYCSESSLDVQQISAMAQSSYNIDFGMKSDSDVFVEFLTQLLDMQYPSLVNSISWGEDEGFVTSDEMDSWDTEAAKLGLQGVTILVASGDDGVHGPYASMFATYCQGFYHPDWPATSPYVVAVGATQGIEVNKKEITCSYATAGLITSGGGFSVSYPMPDYQKNVVAAYQQQQQKLGLWPDESTFMSTGRAYPDVSAAGAWYPTVVDGFTYDVFGTSASTPVFAGIITLVNDQRMTAGKSPVGFVNPALYNLTSDAWIDITDGDNSCTATGNCCGDGGFAAGKGWDAATGFGSPNFEKLAAQLVALP